MSLKPILLLLAALLLIAPVAAAEPPAAAAKPLSLSVGRTIRLQMAKKQIIKSVVIDRDGILKVVPAFNDPRTLLITGLPGKARVVITGEDGEKMALSVGQ